MTISRWRGGGREKEKGNQKRKRQEWKKNNSDTLL